MCVFVCICVWEHSVSCLVATHVVAYKPTHTFMHTIAVLLCSEYA